ncbi:UDP-3-O-(3-hydroxymyristoyl)glucosamine N-acyltransferase [Tsuneonella sp. HG094]
MTRIAPNPLERDAIEIICGCEIANADSLERVDGLTTLELPLSGKLAFRDQFDDKLAERIGRAPADMLWVLPSAARGRIDRPSIYTDTPRVAFSAIAVALFDYFGAYWTGALGAEEANARWPHSTFMPGSYVHPSARIGPGALVWPGVVIGPNVTIGRNALIKANAVIGLPGFGVGPDASGNLQHLPHLGGVVIGDDVEVGALDTICAGTILPTVVEDNVKCDDHVHIAHNCRIGANTQLTAHVELSGSTVIGKNCILSPNCSTVNGTQIGDGALIGIAANVTKNVEPHTVVVGNPARPIRRIGG